MSDTGKRIIAIGEVLWDQLPQGDVLGGAPLNFINRVNELGHLGTIVSRVGDDALGHLAIKKLNALGLQTDFIQLDDKHPTGTVKVFLDDSKTPTYEIVREVAYDYIDFLDAHQELVRNAECLYFGSLINRNKHSRNTVRDMVTAYKGEVILTDINLRSNCYTRDTVTETLGYSTILKLNNEELDLLKEIIPLDSKSVVNCLKELIDRFELGYCLITYGEGGVFAGSREGEILYVPSFKADLIDPLGAGDAFSAGFIHKLLNSHSFHDSCLFGNYLGGLVANQRGATTTIVNIKNIRLSDTKQNSSIEEFKDYIKNY